MKAIWATLMCACLGGAGCGAGDGAMDASRPDSAPHDASGEDAGVALPGCAGAGLLELGRCELPGGGQCTGTPDEGGLFVSLTPGDSVPVVRGPQGFQMLIFAARTRGIAAGDPSMPSSSANPRLELHLLDASGTEQSLYRGRSAFLPEEGAPDRFFNAGLFVVVDPAATGLSGAEADVLGKLTDATGELRCGSVHVFVSP
ncbi:MAG: hypothetical protein GXP55_17060 [Deltaproteobacteria bacterium]|nr:hypothetical protein [Deltaproteobacteria bacterium]